MIFETHAHYEDHKFNEDRDELLAALPSCGVSPVINVGSKLSTTEESVKLAQKYDYIYAAVGIHPSEIGDLQLEPTVERLRELAQYEKTVAIGEIGLDYYWDKEPEVQSRQREWFRAQLKLASEVNLPVIIHSRDAAADTLEIMGNAAAEGIPGVIHCYSYSPEIAQEYVKMGYYIGVGGVVTFKNAKKLVQTVEQIPLERILLETDCPYMAPEPHRGQRNDSRYIPHIIEKIAQIKGITPDVVESTTADNAYRLFKIQACR
ncbi:MAG: TatD family hydrolase [Agathobacter sp.]|uniref:TatD family hydrolase n=1 Tax=Agathobacter sp. TaxID=2021311 RepID=UPI00258585FF|nr:TatD family hydrolase [Agathobacter sp.]MCR5676959.1 TatD family hydrolase [Agathobacter sp.]